MTVANILGLPINCVTMAETLDWISATVTRQAKAQICTPNVDHLVLAQRDSGFRKVIEHAALVVPDSHWVVWAGRFLGYTVPEVVAGSELLVRCCEEASSVGLRLYFLGAEPGVAESAATCLRARFAGLQIAGTFSPTRHEISHPDATGLLARVNAAKPHVLFVAFGTPLQEKWIAQWLDELQIHVAIGIGSGLDYIAGVQRRAPKWMYHAGLEWFYRLTRDPLRLIPRYLLRDPIFFALLLSQKLRPHSSN